MTMHHAVRFSVVVALSIVRASGQSATPTFEVASIGLSPPGAMSSQRVTETRIDFTGTPLRALILIAFDKKPYELVGPAWLDDVRVDVRATYPPAATRKQVPEMLERLLIARFHLETHIEPRKVELYELQVSPSGPRFSIAEPKAQQPERTATPSGATFETVNGTESAAVTAKGLRLEKGDSVYTQRTTERGTTEIDAERLTMADLCNILRMNLDRPVVDKTGLSGAYRFKVELDRSAQAIRILHSLGLDLGAFEAPSGISTFKAIESLGLMLNERRSPCHCRLSTHSLPSIQNPEHRQH